MRRILCVALGSALGGLCRYGLDRLAVALPWGALPPSTLWVNFSGSVCIGWLAGRWAAGGAASPHPHKWHFWMTGFCGGYTTFSAFAWQILVMIRDGRPGVAGFYAAAAVVSGLLGVWIGLAVALRRR